MLCRTKVDVTYEQFVFELAYSLQVDSVEYLNENLNFELSLNDQEHIILDELDMLNTVLDMEELYDTGIDDDEWETLWRTVPVNQLHEELQKLQ